MKKRKLKGIKQKVKMHPVMMLLYFIIFTIILSGILKLFNVSFAYNSINPARLDYIATTESVTSLFNLSGIKYIFANTVANFANFTILAHLIIVLLGIGVMEYSGFLKTAVGFLTRKAKKNQTTFVIVLICLLSSMLGNLPFIAFIPLTALIYKYGKRNPLIGVVTSFASLTCGYGLSILFTSIDSSLKDLTVLSASMLDPTYNFKTYSFILIMAVSIIALAFLITSLVENYIVRKLPKYEFEEEISEGELNHFEKKGLLLATLGSLLYLIILIYNIIPGLPLSGNLLNHNEALYINMLFGENSFFADGFVFIITLLFIIWGVLYGIGAKTIKNNRDFIDALGYSLNGVGKILVYIFASATLVAIFKQTNIGNVLVAGLTSLITKTGVSGISLVVLLFVCTMLATLVLPNSVSKWTIMAPSVIPAFLNAGMSAEFAQVVFRLGECGVVGLTPIFSYFIIYLAYLEKYNKDQDNLSIAEALKYQTPFALSTSGVLLAIVIIWYLISLPLGIGAGVSI